MTTRNWDSYFSAVKKQDWVSAERALALLAKEEKDNPNVFLKMGDVCQRLGATPHAIASYHRAARLLSEAGFGQKAIALYKIILRLDPDDRDALGRSAGILNEIESARHLAVHSAKIAEPPSPEKQPDILRVPALFSGMSADDYRKVLGGLEQKVFNDGEKVIEEGDSGDSLYLIESGRARVTAHLLGREVELAVLGEGDVFGEVAFITGRPRTAGVIALGQLRVYEIGRMDIEEIIQKNPGVLSVLEDFYEKRARDTIRKVRSV